MFILDSKNANWLIDSFNRFFISFDGFWCETIVNAKENANKLSYPINQSVHDKKNRVY